MVEHAAPPMPFTPLVSKAKIQVGHDPEARNYVEAGQTLEQRLRLHSSLVMVDALVWPPNMNN